MSPGLPSTRRAPQQGQRCSGQRGEAPGGALTQKAWPAPNCGSHGSERRWCHSAERVRAALSVGYKGAGRLLLGNNIRELSFTECPLCELKRFLSQWDCSFPLPSTAFSTTPPSPSLHPPTPSILYPHTLLLSPQGRDLHPKARKTSPLLPGKELGVCVCEEDIYQVFITCQTLLIMRLIIIITVASMIRTATGPPLEEK